MDSCVSDGQSVVYIRSNSVRPRVSSYISFFTHYQFILTSYVAVYSAQKLC